MEVRPDQHEQLISSTNISYLYLFKDLVQPLKVQGEETGFYKDVKEIREKLLNNYKVRKEIRTVKILDLQFHTD